MTGARQERKPRGIRALGSAALMALAVAAGAPAVRAAITDRVVFNRYTGLAIEGFDPVAYFVDGKPRAGRAEFELRSAGATWRFANDGNRQAFEADPQVYAPQFGGHDPVAVARGVAAPGHPALWLVIDQRLYLFYSEEARAAFAQDPGNAADAAERHWPEVLRSLLP